MEIDEITSALSEHDNCVKLSKELAKVLAAKFGKQDKDKKNKNKTNTNKSRKKCSHCDAPTYKKDKCWYLTKEGQLTNWKPYPRKE